MSSGVCGYLPFFLVAIVTVEWLSSMPGLCEGCVGKGETLKGFLMSGRDLMGPVFRRMWSGCSVLTRHVESGSSLFLPVF